MSTNGERYTLRAAAYLLLVKNNEILLCRRFNTGWRNGEYSMIAGHLDAGESIRTTIVRESKEEAGITIKKEALRFVHVMQQYEGAQYFDFYFTVDSWEGEPSIREPDKCDDMRWFPLNALPDNIIPNVRQAIEAYKSGDYFSEIGIE